MTATDTLLVLFSEDVLRQLEGLRMDVKIVGLTAGFMVLIFFVMLIFRK